MNPLSALGLCKQFETVRAVDGVSLALASREVRGLLGPNGAGKTRAAGPAVIRDQEEAEHRYSREGSAGGGSAR